MDEPKSTSSSRTRPRLLLGAHFPISGGLHHAAETAAEYGCNVFQLFTKNALTWKERNLTEEEARRFTEAIDRTGARPAASHASYLINLAASDPGIAERSSQALEKEIQRCDRLGIPNLVLHPGAHGGLGLEEGMARIVRTIARLLENTDSAGPRILLETTAGQGSGIGFRFEQIAVMLKEIASPARTGVCLDTCHIFAAGYDIRTPEKVDRRLAEFDRMIGIHRLHLIHLNDSVRPLGGRVDRHAHIGKGEIGVSGFRRILAHPALCGIPMVIETPKGKKGDDFDRMNLSLLRELSD